MSSSKLRLICDKTIEAGWLTAVIVAPLYFSGYSSTVMDADKLALLRSIATIMMAAWFVRWVDDPTTHYFQLKPSWRSPMVFSVLFLVGAYLVATVTSIVPRTSLFGSYNRAQGTYTLLSFVVVYAMILQGLRTRQQLDRLIVTIILTSLPIALYGLLQKCGLDPQVWSSNFDGRSGSTVGNPIFLAAYLIMTFALTLGKIMTSLRTISATKQSEEGSLAQVFLVIVYVLIAATQAVAIFLTDSRGPFLGWSAGIIFFVMLLAVVWNKRKWILGAVGLTFAGALFLITLNLPNTPLQELRRVPAFARLGNLINPGGTGEFRLFTWENAAHLVLPHEPIQFPDGTPDGLNLIRPIVGYGPDAMPLVYSQVSPASPFSREAGTDRSHNATWDAWVTTGILGLGAYQLLFLCIFLSGLRCLGLITTNRDRNWFVGLWTGLGVTGALLAIGLGQFRYLGLVLPVGNVIALVLYLIGFALHRNIQPQADLAHGNDQILLAALLAGLFAHYVESQFGIDVPPAQIIYWVFMGLLVVLGSSSLNVEPEPSPSTPRLLPKTIPSWIGSTATYSIIIGTILSTLIYGFVKYEKGQLDALSILWRELTYDPVRNITTYVILGLILLVWLLATILTSAEMIISHAFKTSKSRYVGIIGLTILPIVLTGIFAWGLSSQLASLPYLQTPVERVDSVFALARQVLGIIDYYTFTLFALVLMAVFALILESKSLPARWSLHKWGYLALVPIIPVVIIWINMVNLNPIRADVTYRLGQLFDDQSDLNAAIALYTNAIRLARSNDTYYMTLAHAFQKKAALASTTVGPVFSASTTWEEIQNLDDQHLAGLSRLDLLYATQAILMQARDLNPLYADHTINLARFYLPELPIDTPSKAKLLDLTTEYYIEAQRLSPNSVLLWNERADFDLNYRNDSESAVRKLDESLERDPTFEETYLKLGEIYTAAQDFDQAIRLYRRALTLSPAMNQVQGRLGFIYFRQGKLDDAIQAYQKYIELAPDAPNLWEAYKNMALLYRQTGDLSQAITQATTAAILAPREMLPQLNDLIERWRLDPGKP